MGTIRIRNDSSWDIEVSCEEPGKHLRDARINYNYKKFQLQGEF